MKKVLMMCFMLVIAFTMVGCNQDNLSHSKGKAKEEINNYFELLNENDYSKENWSIIRNVVYKNHNLIEVEEDMKEIENIKKLAMKEIDRVKPNELTDEWILKNFDISEEKLYCTASINDDFATNAIIVTLKKTNTYPELDMECFNLENTIRIEYASDVIPPDYFFQPEYKDLLENFRQIIFIYVEPLGKEEIINSIKELEKLSFIRSANPNYVVTGA